MGLPTDCLAWERPFNRAMSIASDFPSSLYKNVGKCVRRAMLCLEHKKGIPGIITCLLCLIISILTLWKMKCMWIWLFQISNLIIVRVKLISWLA